MNYCVYDSRSLFYKKPFGAIKTDEVTTFTVNLPHSSGLMSPKLVLFQADRWNEPFKIDMTFRECSNIVTSYSCTFSCAVPQLLFYCFEATNGATTVQIRKCADGTAAIGNDNGWLWQLTVYDKEMKTPDFLKGGILYQIFPDRYYDSKTPKENVPIDRVMHQNWSQMPNYLPNQNGIVTNSDYFGGDLKGIELKLSKLVELGVTAIYLNPIFEAQSNHRYNTADYMKIDPLLGTEQDFKSLCEQAKQLGIKIILDGVFNHTGSDSIYFNKIKRYGEGGAFNDPESDYRNWYKFNDYPNNYESWWGFDTLPTIDESDPSFREFLCGDQGVLKKWLSLGASGYRLDVVDELSDITVDTIHRSVKSFDEQCCIIGEVWEDASNKSSYGVRRSYLLGDQLDSVMNYPFKNAIIAFVRYGDCANLIGTVLSILENYPKPVVDVLMNSLSTHDTERILTSLIGEPCADHGRDWQVDHNMLSREQYEQGKKLLKLAAVIQYMLPGTPCTYYGDEVGVYGYKDPFNRTTYPWGAEDKELLAFFCELGKVRRSYDMLKTAEFLPVFFSTSVACFIRYLGEEQLFVAVNRTQWDNKIEVPPEFEGKYPVFGNLIDQVLPPYGYVIL